MRISPLDCGLAFAFLIELPHGLYLVDSGSPGQQGVVMTRMKALGRTDLRLIWISHAHYDHYGSASALREATGAPIAIHPADAGFLSAGLSPLGTPRAYGMALTLAFQVANRARPLSPTLPDITIEGGESLERFGLDAAVLHTPGHTPGHTCLVLEGGIAFAADLVARRPYTRLQSLLATDWASLPSSLEALKAAQPEWIYTGHSPIPISGKELQNIHPLGRNKNYFFR